MKTRLLLPTLLTAALLFFTIGCDTAAGPDAAEADASADVAASVASLLSEDTGGLLDQVTDVFDLATAGDIQDQAATLAAKSAVTSPIERSYDPATGTWTLSFSRDFTSPDGQRTASIRRLYEVQFLDAAGMPQQFFVTSGDTARAINFVIVEGSGTLETPRLSAARTDITGAWTATGVHTDEVTINGTYGRSGAHTLTTENAVRTLDYTAALDVVDLVGPKGSRRDLSQKISGTLTGTYQGQATFTRGDLYRERDIDRTVEIVIDNGVLTITVNGQPFTGDVGSGDVSPR